MDTGTLNMVCQEFRNALLPMAPQLVDILHPSFMVFLKLAFVLLLLGLMFGASDNVMSGLFIGTLAIGLSHFGLIWGAWITEGFFAGTVRVAEMLGVPSPDPSGLASWGMAVADPIFKALDAQGVWSYVSSPIIHLTFEAAAWAIAGSYIVLAAMLVGFLIMSYVLVGIAPFFLMFSVLPIVNSLTTRWITLVFATLSGMMATLFLAAGMQRIGAGLLATLQNKFLAPGVTLVADDYLQVLVVGFVLIVAFVWIAYKFAGVGAGVAMDLISGVSGMVYGTAGAVSSVMSGSGGGSKQVTSTNGSGQQQIPSSSSSGWGGGGFGGGSSGMGKATAPAKSSWSTT